MLEQNDSDWPAVRRSIKWAQIVWRCLRQLLTKDHADPKTMTSIYKKVIQAVFLYGSELWVLTATMESALRSFRQKCTRYITGKHIQPDPNDPDGTIK
jgi:hypothetical protein